MSLYVNCRSRTLLTIGLSDTFILDALICSLMVSLCTGDLLNNLTTDGSAVFTKPRTNTIHPRNTDIYYAGNRYLY